jgi:hypothetical protein
MAHLSCRESLFKQEANVVTFIIYFHENFTVLVLSNISKMGKEFFFYYTCLSFEEPCV